MISDETIRALASGIPAFLTSLATLIAVMRGNKRVDQKVNRLADNVDGKMQELIDSTGRENLATGRAEGLAEGRSEQAK